MKIVLDTNVLISALIKAGSPRELFFKITGGKNSLISSKNIIEEFVEVSNDPKIRQYVGEEEVVEFLRVLSKSAKLVRIRSHFKVIKEDPEDDIMLRTAVDGKADFIVSGYKHLLSLGNFRGKQVVTITRMLQILSKY